MEGVDKLFQPVGGRPLLAWTLDVFQRHPLVDWVVVATAAGEISRCWEEIIYPYGIDKVVAVVAGGAERQESVCRGLAHLPSSCQLVAVHDGARPFLRLEVLTRCIEVAEREGAALAAVPVVDTIKVAGNDGYVERTLPREGLWAAQTPQVFARDLLTSACERAQREGFVVTDDSALVERAGHPVRLVPGDADNFKVTTPADLPRAMAMAGSFGWPRVGLGYDVHRLVPGRPLVLGGVAVPSEVGLDGHSDADVLLHALMDALLGAAAAGDIGHHFPPSDPRYAGASSLILLRRVVQILVGRGYRPRQVDAVVVAEKPLVSPFIPEMRAAVAKALEISPLQVGIKASTNEGLGFIGAGEGMAAWAVATIG